MPPSILSLPPLAEALYDAAWRWSALIEIYKTEEEPKKSEEARAKAIALAQQASSQSGPSDWVARAQRLLYLIDQSVPDLRKRNPVSTLCEVSILHRDFSVILSCNLLGGSLNDYAAVRRTGDH